MIFMAMILLTSLMVGVAIDVWSSDDEAGGNSGDDILTGDEGANTLQGGSGDDILSGLEGWDDLFGGPGDDVLDGGDGADYMDGGGGSDWLIGGQGPDEMIGGDGADLLEGGIGDDLMSGSGGDDALFGGFGADTMTGGNGNDLLDGTWSESATETDFGYDEDKGDTLDGGNGDDILILGNHDHGTGGDGNDTFISGGFVVAGKAPVIEDYQSDEDAIVLMYDQDLASAPTITLQESGGNTMILMDGVVTAQVAGVVGLDLADIALVPAAL